MKPEVKKYTLTVFGDSYTIVSDEPEQHILAAANHVDRLMNDISAKAQDMPVQKLAVLAALKIALTAHSLEVAQEDTKTVIKNLINSLPSSL